MRRYFEKLEAVRYLPNSGHGPWISGWLQTRLTPLILVLEDLKVLSLVIAAATAHGPGSCWESDQHCNWLT